MGAALGGATFPAARQVRQSMTIAQLHDFASGPEKGKPAHVAPKPAKAASHAGQHPHRNLGAYLHDPKGRK
jgi:hypothetical protein